MTGLIVRRHDAQNAFATDVAGADVAIGQANLLSLVDRAVTTLTYVVGDETKAIAAIFAL